MTDRDAVTWPDSAVRPDPWDDGCWPSLDERGRYPDLWAAWRTLQAAGLDDPDTPAAAEMARQAERYGLTDPFLWDRNRPDWGYPTPSVDDLVRITTDTWPAAGMDAPDAVLGPRSLFASPLERRVAVAGCAFVWTDGWPQSSFHVWCRDKPIPSTRLRATFRAVGLAPWAVWRVVGRDGDRFTLADHTGLGEFYQPHGPVRVIGQEPTGEGLAARVLLTEDGWIAHVALDVPRLPPAPLIDRWVALETWMARTVQPGITREALLRKRPVVVRRSLERADVL